MTTEVELTDIDNEHFHCKDKGCKLKEITFFRNDKRKSSIKCQFCEIHEVNVCRCGWEIGWHYGLNSKDLK